MQLSRHTVGVPTGVSPTPQFSLGFGRRGDSVVVAVTGDLDAATAGRLEARLEDLIVGQGNLSILVDLRQMTFIDSQGLTVLAKACKQAQARGGELRVEHASPSAARVLEITGLDRLLTASPHRDR